MINEIDRHGVQVWYVYLKGYMWLWPSLLHMQPMSLFRLPMMSYDVKTHYACTPISVQCWRGYF